MASLICIFCLSVAARNIVQGNSSLWISLYRPTAGTLSNKQNCKGLLGICSHVASAVKLSKVEKYTTALSVSCLANDSKLVGRLMFLTVTEAKPTVEKNLYIKARPPLLLAAQRDERGLMIYVQWDSRGLSDKHRQDSVFFLALRYTSILLGQ